MDKVEEDIKNGTLTKHKAADGQFYGTVPDDDPFTDLYHPSVPDGQRTWRFKYHFRLGIPWYCHGFRYFPAETGLYDPSKRYGRSGQTGWLQYRPDFPVYHGASYPFQHGRPGNLYSSVCF